MTSEDMDTLTVSPSSIAMLIDLIDEGIINYGTATQKIFPHLTKYPHTDIEAYILHENLKIQSTDETDIHIEAALTKHAQKITEYKKGKKGLLSLFVGEVMKLSKGKANAEEVSKKILEKLNQ